MPFSQEEQDRIGRFLADRGVQSCVACGFQGRFLFGDMAVLVTNVGTDTHGEPTINGPGVVPIACPQCGYTMLFDGRSLPL